MSQDDPYVLRSRDETERERLGSQHRVWWDVTRQGLQAAGFRRGHAVADLGCGPGHLTLDLADLVGPAGTVLAIDSSERFIRDLGDRAAREERSQVEARVGDARDSFAADGSLDGVVCRWVLMFVDGVEQVMERVARALRPGGTFLAMEYVQFRSIALHPHGKAFARTYGAVHDLIAAAGGDADVGGRLPSLMSSVGLQVEDVQAHLLVGRPRDPVWRWLEAVHRNHENLVDAGLLTAAELEDYYAEWDRAAETPGAFVSAPPLLTVVARKR